MAIFPVIIAPGVFCYGRPHRLSTPTLPQRRRRPPKSPRRADHLAGHIHIFLHHRKIQVLPLFVIFRIIAYGLKSQATAPLPHPPSPPFSR